MNILTFDLEDWFHILDVPETADVSKWNGFESRIEKNTDRILDLLQKKNQSATWFILGWVAKKYPDLIKKISNGHEIGYHSSDHKLVYKSTPSEVRIDLAHNIPFIENLCGKRVVSYRAPGFSFTPETKWLVNVLAEAGIKYDCSIFPAARNHGGYASFPNSGPTLISCNGTMIREFPLNKTVIGGKDIIFSGGGYFRLLPYFILKKLMSNSDYVMTYFHPRDFDPHQPVLDLSIKRKFMSYTGLKNSFSKLNRLLEDFKFITVEEAAKQTDWNNTPLINLEKY